MNRIKEKAEFIKNYINKHIFELVFINQLSKDMKLPIRFIGNCFSYWYRVNPKAYVEWGKITMFAGIYRLEGVKYSMRDYAMMLGYSTPTALCKLIERMFNMKMENFVKAVSDNSFYKKLMDNPFVRLNSDKLIKAMIKNHPLKRIK